jgi:hypothetical protein
LTIKNAEAEGDGDALLGQSKIANLPGAGVAVNGLGGNSANGGNSSNSGRDGRGGDLLGGTPKDLSSDELELSSDLGKEIDTLDSKDRGEFELGQRSENVRDWKGDSVKESSTGSIGETSDVRTSADRARIAENVMDKARLLLTKGGGSMAFQMNMDNNEVLNIAIKLSGDQLSLRLAGDNNQTVDRIASELSGLESSLKTQNIQLTGVEVGTNVDSDANQDDGGSAFDGQQQNQQQAQQEDNSIENLLSNFSDTFTGISETVESGVEAAKNSVADLAPKTNSNGKISVAV